MRIEKTKITQMDNPFVSIVLPTFNCAHFIDRAIRSVIEQTYPHWELLIVDNHSTDNTLEVVQRFNDSRIKLLQINNEGVIAKSRNLGIQKATGRWIAFLDADDWWTADKLKLSVGVLASGQDLVFHDLIRMGPGKRLINGRRVKTRQLSSPIFHDLLANGNGIVNSSVVVSRNILLKIGGLSESPLLVAAEDYDCWLRIAQHTENFYRLKCPAGFYWIGKNNLSLHVNALNYLNELRYLYFSGEINPNSNDLPQWFIFSMTKIYISRNNYEKALAELSKLPKLKLSCRLFLRIAILKIICHVHLCLKKWS